MTERSSDGLAAALYHAADEMKYAQWAEPEMLYAAATEIRRLSARCAALEQEQAALRRKVAARELHIQQLIDEREASARKQLCRGCNGNGVVKVKEGTAIIGQASCPVCDGAGWAFALSTPSEAPQR